MKSVRVLILDSCPDGHLAVRVEKVLQEAGSIRNGPGTGNAVHIWSMGRDRADGEPLSACVRVRDPHLLILCVSGGHWREAEALLSEVRNEGPQRPVIVAGSGMEPEELCGLVERGATDFVLEPFSRVELATRLLRVRREMETVGEGGGAPTLPGLRHLMGQDPGWRRVVEQIPILAGCGASVLILGETGTGKELCARAIHQLGARKDRPFTPLNCGAIPAELVENELFGHTCGAYTGATSSATGIVPSADGGTLFLDEVDTLPLGAQVKLLRFLQSKEYRQVGGVRLLRADVRIVAASNADPAEAVRTGRLRSDLYYRLNVMTLRLPPLRSRREDVPLLARHFMERFARENGKDLTGLTGTALQRLAAHDWPGNIRELENVMERAVIVARDTRIRAEDIQLNGTEEGEVVASFKAQKARAVANFERAYVRELLSAHDGNISRAARAAQKNRRAFWELIRKHRLTVGTDAPSPIAVPKVT